jgi:hypothetical protein
MIHNFSEFDFKVNNLFIKLERMIRQNRRTQAFNTAKRTMARIRDAMKGGEAPSAAEVEAFGKAIDVLTEKDPTLTDPLFDLLDFVEMRHRMAEHDKRVGAAA